MPACGADLAERVRHVVTARRLADAGAGTVVAHQ